MNPRTANAARTALLGRMGGDSSHYWADSHALREPARPDQVGVIGLDRFSPACRQRHHPEDAWLNEWASLVETYRQVMLTRVDGYYVPRLPAMDKQSLQIDVFIGGHREAPSFERSIHVALLLNATLRHVPDYDKAFERLAAFVEEDEDWDGYGGQPASQDTAVAVSLFLFAVKEKSLVRPSLTLSNSGAVSVVWKRERNYVTATFKGRERYVATVTRNGESKFAVEGTAGMLPEELEQYLLENFKDDARDYLLQL
ncbi:hypothetical protein D9M70_469860 [compost metagenome]